MKSTVHYRHYNKGFIHKGTIAISIHKNKLLVGFSECSPKDNYRKDIGRNVAHARLNSNPVKIKLKLIKKRFKDDTHLLTKSALVKFLNNLQLSDLHTDTLFDFAQEAINQSDKTTKGII